MHISNLIDGLQILQGVDFDATVCAEHDQIFAGSKESISPADAERMEALGWHRDGEDGEWYAWV